MSRVLLLSALLLALSACGGLEHIGTEQGDRRTYREFSYNFTSGETVMVYRVFESEGRLGICAYLTRRSDASAFGKELTKKWFGQAKLSVMTQDRESTPFGYGDFMMVRDTSGSVFNAEATCVRSETPWNEAYNRAIVFAEGPRRVVGRF